ncbi:MAG TPA: FecR domain-containing protein [Puia sp.]|nr:FecR domain-containing protein [Puia sp.]
MKLQTEHIRSLLFEKIAGTISPENHRLVDEALRNDEHIRRMWEEIQAGFHKPEAKRFLSTRDADDSWKSLAVRLQPRDVRRPLLLRPGTWAAAAVFAGVFFLGLYLYPRISGVKTTVRPAIAAALPSNPELRLADGTRIDLSDPASRQIDAGKIKVATSGKTLTYSASGDSALQWASLYVPNKRDYKLSLPDGSKVWLNAASSLRFPYAFNGGTREVYLEGEGYFQIARNTARPFIVHTRSTSVTVLGTSFNIDAYEADKPVTSLVEGAVRTSAGDAAVTLQPGYQAVYAGQRFSTSPFDSTDVLSWMSGVSYFHGVPLAGISSILSRWFDVKVVFDDPEIARQQFSGAIYKEKPVQVFLTNISISSGIQSYYSADGTLHLK